MSPFLRTVGLISVAVCLAGCGATSDPSADPVATSGPPFPSPSTIPTPSIEPSAIPTPSGWIDYPMRKLGLEVALPPGWLVAPPASKVADLNIGPGLDREAELVIYSVGNVFEDSVIGYRGLIAVDQDLDGFISIVATDPDEQIGTELRSVQTPAGPAQAAGHDDFARGLVSIAVDWSLSIVVRIEADHEQWPAESFLDSILLSLVETGPPAATEAETPETDPTLQAWLPAAINGNETQWVVKTGRAVLADRNTGMEFVVGKGTQLDLCLLVARTSDDVSFAVGTFTEQPLQPLVLGACRVKGMTTAAWVDQMTALNVPGLDRVDDTPRPMWHWPAAPGYTSFVVTAGEALLQLTSQDPDVLPPLLLDLPPDLVP